MVCKKKAEFYKDYERQKEIQNDDRERGFLTRKVSRRLCGIDQVLYKIGPTTNASHKEHNHRGYSTGEHFYFYFFIFSWKYIFISCPDFVHNLYHQSRVSCKPENPLTNQTNSPEMLMGKVQRERRLKNTSSDINPSQQPSTHNKGKGVLRFMNH